MKDVHSLSSAFLTKGLQTEQLIITSSDIMQGFHGEFPYSSWAVGSLCEAAGQITGQQTYGLRHQQRPSARWIFVFHDTSPHT